MENLAIMGHKTRGEEVIALLEMLGGKNNRNFNGINATLYYYLKFDEYLGQIVIETYNTLEDREEPTTEFTLEEFLDKFPFKVGDIVSYNGWRHYITGCFWRQKTVIYVLKGKLGSHIYAFAEDLKRIDTPIQKVTAGKTLLFGRHKCGNRVDSLGFLDEFFDDKVELVMNGYELKEEDGKLYAVKKKPKYPKTYEECCKVLDKSPILNCPNLCICERHPETFEMKEHFSFREEMSETHIAFLKLLTCRDAYWEIAGVQMKLGKHWEPDWAHGNEKFYCISTSENEIVSGEWDIDNKIIAFPTEEICVVFYDNFKELINSCKELL